jgi:hypothetical protein
LKGWKEKYRRLDQDQRKEESKIKLHFEKMLKVEDESKKLKDQLIRAKSKQPMEEFNP